MKKKKLIISISLILICTVIGLCSIYFYSKYIPSGILWRNEISSEEVKLELKENDRFHYYLYEKSGGAKGVITLRKKEGTKWWSLYRNETGLYQQKIDSPDVELFRSTYPTYMDHHLRHIPVWGGVVHLGDYDSISIYLNNKKHRKYLPNTTAKEDGKMYFFFSSPDNLDHEDIEVSIP